LRDSLAASTWQFAPLSVARVLSERVDCAVANLALRLGVWAGNDISIGRVVLDEKDVVDPRSNVSVEGQCVGLTATDRDAVDPSRAENVGRGGLVLRDTECELSSRLASGYTYEFNHPHQRSAWCTAVAIVCETSSEDDRIWPREVHGLGGRVRERGTIKVHPCWITTALVDGTLWDARGEDSRDGGEDGEGASEHCGSGSEQKSVVG
jgi:hypothetical protein